MMRRASGSLDTLSGRNAMGVRVVGEQRSSRTEQLHPVDRIGGWRLALSAAVAVLFAAFIADRAVWNMVSLGASPSDVTSRPPVKRRRVIFNLDSYGVLKNSGGDLEKYIRDTFTGLENSHVDALFWMDGAGGNTANYDSNVLELVGQRIGKIPPALRKMLDNGNDPPRVVVREAKKRGLDVFFSFRINDIHDSFLPEEFPTFKEEHPEWMIGAGRPYGVKTALNFAVPEVRRIKFDVIKEIFQKYDFDGIEIDFLRSPTLFIPGEEPKNAHILTQFLRDVRRHLDHRGKERGRPIEIAVHVNESLEACRLDGFDVPTWVTEGLIDILTLGSGVIDIAVEEFKRVTEGRGVLVYPCLYGWPSRYMPIPPELARGLALNYWHQGADGIYTYNWFPHETKREYQIGLLKELGDRAAMASKSLMFAADRGKPQRQYPHNWMHTVLPAGLSPGKVLDVPLMVGVDLARQVPGSAVELRVEAGEAIVADTLRLALNGKPVNGRNRGGEIVVAALSAGKVVRGRNNITVALADGLAGTKEAITIKAVEIHVAISGPPAEEVSGLFNTDLSH